MILRGPESLQYPTRKEFQHLAAIMDRLRSIHHRRQIPDLLATIGQLIPHEFAGCGSYNLRKRQLDPGYTSFDPEMHHLYATQGFATDPAIQLLQQTQIGTVSSEDSPSLVVPRQVTSLKLDFGIKTCLSVGVRGVLGVCSYFAFSNFDQKQIWKLRTMLQILGPHLHLAYLRATTPEPPEPPATRPALTPREEEIMKWVAEGKTNWEISIILKVSLNTIKFHLKNIYQKLGGVENRWTAIAQWQNGAAIMNPIAHDSQEH